MSNWLDHSSIVGHIGGYGDRALNPLSWVTKGKWTHFTSDVLPAKVNGGLSTVMKPFEKVDKTINPVRRIPIVNRVGDIVANKPGDALALAAGAFFGGGALMGGGAGAGAGGAGAGGTELGAGGVGTTSGFGGVGVDAGATGFGGDGLGALAGGGELPAAGEVGAGELGADGLATAPTTSSGFGGVGTDPGVTASPDGGSALQADQASAAKADRMQKLGKLMQQQAQQQQRQREIDASRVNVDTPNLQNPYATSSKAKKTAPTGNVAEAMARGAAGCDPIDTNGVQAAAIQEISKRIQGAKARLAALQKEQQ